MTDAAPTKDAPAKQYQLVGGELCLDFCNTVGGKREGIARENLHAYENLISWCEQARVLTHSQADFLQSQAHGQRHEAALVLARAVALRESIYRILFRVVGGRRPSATDLALVNSELARTLGRLRIEPVKGESRYDWKWAEDQLELDYPLGPLSHSAGQLLSSSHKLAHVRQCRGDNCGWLFVDLSKNHSRCWCDMRDCGNRAKVRRHRQKHRA